MAGNTYTLQFSKHILRHAELVEFGFYVRDDIVNHSAIDGRLKKRKRNIDVKTGGLLPTRHW